MTSVLSGSYYIVLPTGSEIVQTTPATPLATAAPPPATRVMAASRLQQAAFIPLSRLEPVQQVQATSSATAHVVESGAGGSKEIKRRVSHNEGKLRESV